MQSEEIERFDAISNDGDKQTMIVEHSLVPIPNRGNPNGTMPGMKRVRLRNGDHRNRIDDDHFKVVQTAKIYRPVRTKG